MFKTRLLRVVLAGIVVGAATLSSFANSIDLHVALIETRPVEVDLFLPKDGAKAGFVGLLTGGLGGAFYGLAVEARNKQFADELAAGLDPDWNRIEPLQAAMESAFATRARATKLSFSTNAQLLIDNKPNFAEIAKTGSSFVLLLEPSAAYKTANTEKARSSPEFRPRPSSSMFARRKSFGRQSCSQARGRNCLGATRSPTPPRSSRTIQPPARRSPTRSIL